MVAISEGLSSADMALLKLLVEGGPHRFPLITNEADDRATLHAESLVVRGLIARVGAKAHTGTTYEVTSKGRVVFGRAKTAD